MKSITFVYCIIVSYSATASERLVSLKTVTGETVTVSVDEIRNAVVPANPKIRPKPVIGEDGRAILSWPTVNLGGVWKYIDASGYGVGASEICRGLGFRSVIGSTARSLGLLMSGTDGTQTVAVFRRTQTDDGKTVTELGVNSSGYAYAEVVCEL